MNSQPTHLMARASIVIEQHPQQLTKTQLVKRIGGKRRRALQAVDLLCSQGYAATTAGPRGWPVYHSLRRYPDEGTDAGTGLPLPSGTGGVPDGNGSAPEQTTSASPAKDRDVPHTTANGGEPAPRIEPRCRVCANGQVRQVVNRQLAEGWSLGAILQGLSGANLELPTKSRVTKDSLETHRRKHFPLEAGAGSVWRNILEQRAEVEAADFERGVLNLVTPRTFLQIVVAKSFAALATDDAEIGPDLGLRAAAELHKLTAAGDEQQRWAEVHAKQARILAAFKTLPPQFQQQVLDAVDNRTPPPRGARLALIEGGVVTDNDFDSGDDDFDEDDDED